MKKIKNDFTDRVDLVIPAKFFVHVNFLSRSVLFLSKFLKFLKSFKFQFMGRARSIGQMLMDSYICPIGPVFMGRLVPRVQGFIGQMFYLLCFICPDPFYILTRKGNPRKVDWLTPWIG